MLRPAAKRGCCTPTDAGHGDGLCLSYDMLLDILRRLPCHAIAQSRTICRAWREIIDDNGLLPRFFTSRSFPGVFTNHTGCRDRSYFLAAPAGSSSRAGDFRHPLFCHGWARVADHCNGLLLLHGNQEIRSFRGNQENKTYVCNPATIRCDELPHPPMGWGDVSEGTFLAFDPAVSLHYEVYNLLFRVIYHGIEEEPKVPVVRSLVFSSQTRQWEGRVFVPGRCAPRYLHNMNTFACHIKQPSAEYWRRSLYVVGRNGVLTILRCTEGTYDLVKLPGEYYKSAGGTYHLPRRSLLASYEKGIHYAELSVFQLKVWALTGLADGQLGWTLLHDANLEPYIHSMQKNSRTTLERMEWKIFKSSKSMGLFRQKDDTSDGVVDDEEIEEQQTYGLECSWNSDDDNIINVDKTATNKTSLKWVSFSGIIGLHPHKEALLLNISGTAVTYHFATSRMQYLTSRLHRDHARPSCAIEGAFPYRPCYDDMLPTRRIPCPPSVLNWWKRKHCPNYNFLDIFQ